MCCLFHQPFDGLYSLLSHAIGLRMVWAGCMMINSIMLDELLELLARKLGAIVGYQDIRYPMAGEPKLAMINHLLGCGVSEQVKLNKS